ncbi:hypothetical protein NDU88_003833 [Pleurodeles waltl]|uniref:Uncharacterized protein n=1 Tax=Pleurodeles waltl TaxID=8319 RepID=A0AAV7UZK7_PLEWA|nr:hypothetical protein NDU88_003833 [Pleurodeles waltl]
MLTCVPAAPPKAAMSPLRRKITGLKTFNEEEKKKVYFPAGAGKKEDVTRGENWMALNGDWLIGHGTCSSFP